LAQTGKPDPEAIMARGSILFNAGGGTGISHECPHQDFIYGIKGALEYGIWRAGSGMITLGGEIGSSNDNLSHNFFLAARSAWHYGWHVRRLDTYAGLSLVVRYYINLDDVYYLDGSHHDQVYPVAGAFVGASYFLNRHFGFNVEAGFDISIVQVGIIFKLR
ncbi:MAG: hypothetical protein Q8926_06535, partial [Bacteroidota bacterium]|nr:hypothetical protein [Bacteroidota bacterium]